VSSDRLALSLPVSDEWVREETPVYTYSDD